MKKNERPKGKLLLEVPVQRLTKKSAFLRKLEKSQQTQPQQTADVLPMFLRRQAE